VQDDGGLPAWVTADFPVHQVSVADVEHPVLVRRDLRVELRNRPFPPVNWNSEISSAVTVVVQSSESGQRREHVVGA
jgi:hypothetical protein